MEKVNLLLVDDEQAIINLWKRSFDPSRSEITEAQSGAKALNFVEELKEKDKNGISLFQGVYYNRKR